MKATFSYDDDGNILAAGIPLPEAYDLRTPRFGVVAEEGRHVAELEIPDEYAGLGLLGIAERLRVQTRETPHRLGAKSTA